MKRKNKQLISLVMAFTMLLSVTQLTFAVENTKDIKGHWAEKSIKGLMDAKIIGGYSDGSIKPNNFITRAEMATLMNGLFGYSEEATQQFKDISEDAWYAGEMLIAREAGYYSGFEGNLAKPGDSITRQDAATMIARVFDVASEFQTSDKFKDANKISAYAKESIDGLVEKSIIGGYQDNSFKPQGNITRAEASKIIDMLSGRIYHTAGTYTNELDSGRAIINTSGVILKDTTIRENLYLTEGIGSGEVVLENVTVGGTTTIAGGGADSIKLINCTLKDTKVVAKKLVRIVGVGTKTSITIGEKAQVILTGDFDTVEVEKGAKVEIKNANIDKIIFIDKGTGKATMNIDDKSKIGQIVAKAPVNITGKGKIGELIIQSEGVTIEQKADKITNIHKQDVKEPEDTEKPDSGSSGGSSQKPTEPKVDTVLSHFTFDSTTEGFESAGTWQADFGTPDVEWSNDLGNGMIKANVVFKGEHNWSEIKLKNTNVADLAKATKLSYDLYFDLSVASLNGNMDKAIDAHYAVEGGTDGDKIGQGADSKPLNQYEKVTLEGKEYAKRTVEALFDQGKLAEKQELWLMIVAKNIPYEGPIYIDNVKVIKSNFEGKDWGNPGVLPINGRDKVAVDQFDLSEVQLVDSLATKETASLFSYMKNVGKDHMLFGHQNTNSQGVTIKNADGTHSDVKNSVGAFPAIYGWDTLALVGGEGEYDDLVRWSKEAAKEGAIITISAHVPNFTKVEKIDGKYDFNSAGSNDTSGNAVATVLDETSEANKAFRAYLDIFAAYTKEIKDENGNPYPMLFRPWHENTGDWFWWGAAHCTVDEYVQLYRYTVEYLRDVQGVHNLLYVYSPNGNFINEEDYLGRYPGDEYVDVIGFDYYHDNPSPGDGKIGKVVHDAEIVVSLANKKGKIPAISETGVRYDNPAGETHGIHPTNNIYKNWYTDFAKAIQENELASQVSMMLVWRNGSRDHCWVPYRNHPMFGHHEMLDDFIEFYNDDYMVFADRLENVYGLDVTNKKQNPYAYIVTPRNREKISGDYEVKVKVFDYGVGIDKIEIAAGNQTVAMELYEENIYIATIDTLKQANNQDLDVTLNVIFKNGKEVTQTIKPKVYNTEKVIKEYTFDNSDEGLNYGGEWADSDASVQTTSEIIHTDGMAGINVVIADDSSGDTEWTWQELKFELPLNDTQDFEDVNYVSYDMFFKQAYMADASSEFTTAAAITVKLGFDKNGVYEETGQEDISMDDWEGVAIGGVDYFKVTMKADLEDMADAANMSFSFIGRDLDYVGPVLVDNIRFSNRISEEVKDSTLVDNFEGYDGDDDTLRSIYKRNSGGGNVILTLDPQEGNTRLKYDYELSPGYAGVAKSLEGVDWNAYDQLEVTADRDNKGATLIFQITATDGQYEYTTVMDQVEQGKMVIPFSEIYKKGTKTPLTRKASYITQFAIYVNAPNNAASDITGTLYFDDIKVTSSGTEPEAPVEETGGYDFEGDNLRGWRIVKELGQDPWTKTDTDSELSKDWKATGEQSLKGRFTFEEGYSFYMLTGDCESLEGKTSITATVKSTENGLVKAMFFIKTGNGWTWFAPVSHLPISEDGTEITIPLDGLTDPAQVKEFGIQFIPDTDPDAACTVYVDNIIIK